MRTSLKIAVALSIGLASSVNAAVVVDNSPDATGFVSSFVAQNIAGQQNFLAQFTLSSATTLTGSSVYSSCRTIGCGAPNLGDAVVIKFTADLGGAPDIGSLLALNSTVSAIDSMGSTVNPGLERVFASFAPTSFAAGTYWFGMSGVNEIGLDLDFALPSAGLWQLQGDALLFSFNGTVSAAFQLESVVPEPATWALMIGGFGMVGAAMRRKAALTA